MRIPIALTPLNGLLIIMMLLAPYMGKLAREAVLKKKSEANLDTVLSRRPIVETKSKKKRPRKRTVSRLAMLEKIESQNLKNNKLNPRKSNINSKPSKLNTEKIEPEFHQGKQLLAQLRSTHNDQPKSARKLSPTEDRNAFVKELKELARSRNFIEAEKVFLTRLEGMNLPPLESLDKQAKFQNHFKQLVDQIDVKSSP